METAYRYWVAKKINNVCCISNDLSITDDYNLSCEGLSN